MGHISVVIIRHDGLDQIQKHPKQFVDNLSQAILFNQPRTSVIAGNHANAADVLQSRHSHDAQLYVLAGGTIAEVGAMSYQQDHWSNKYVDQCLAALDEEKAIQALELQGITRSDAQGIVEVRAMVLKWRQANPWASDKIHPREDWQYEVANQNTSLGYWDWVDNQREMQASD
jgi:hypothetical protein